MYTGINLQYIYTIFWSCECYQKILNALFKREHFKCWTRQYISITVKEQWACVKALGNGNKVWMLAVGYVTHKAGPAEELA